jgi:hypothetical protein
MQTWGLRLLRVQEKAAGIDAEGAKGLEDAGLGREMSWDPRHFGCPGQQY